MDEVAVKVVGPKGERWVMVPAISVIANVWKLVEVPIELAHGEELEFDFGDLVSTRIQLNPDGSEFWAAARIYGTI